MITRKQAKEGTVMFLDIKVGNRVTVDFMKIKDREFLAKGISVLN